MIQLAHNNIVWETRDDDTCARMAQNRASGAVDWRGGRCVGAVRYGYGLRARERANAGLVGVGFLLLVITERLAIFILPVIHSKGNQTSFGLSQKAATYDLLSAGTPPRRPTLTGTTSDILRGGFHLPRLNNSDLFKQQKDATTPHRRSRHHSSQLQTARGARAQREGWIGYACLVWPRR